MEGDPGVGKSAILAEYVRRTGCIAHFNVRLQGLNSAGQFLESVCTQLITRYSRAIELEPGQAEYYIKQGHIRYHLKRYTEALADFNQAVQLQPDNIEAHFYSGVAYERLGRLHETLAAYTRVVELNPQHKDVYYNRGLTYRKLNHPDEALADFMHSVELDPAAADSYTCIGMLLLERGRLLGALTYFNRAVELGEQEASTYAALVSSQLKPERLPDGNVLKFAANTLIKCSTQHQLSREAAKFPVLIDPDFIAQLAEVIEQVPGDELSKGVSRQRVGWLRQIYEQRSAARTPASRQPFGWLRRLIGT